LDDDVPLSCPGVAVVPLSPLVDPPDDDDPVIIAIIIPGPPSL
jgi:hypothetical protein